jgi:hypothetical protein
MLKGQILTLLDLIKMTKDIGELENIKAQREAFVAMADCIEPILKIGRR